MKAVSDTADDLAAAIEGAGGALSGDQSKLFADFARIFLRDVDPALIRVRGAARVADLARTAFDFVAQPERWPRLEVSNPKDCPGRTRILAVQPDRPFLVDTIRLLLRRRELRESCFLHQVLSLSRDADGALDRTGKGDIASVMLIEVAPRVANTEGFTAEIRERLAQLTAVTDDHRKMVRAARELAANVEFAGAHLSGSAGRAEKIRRFLGWLVDDNYVFLGMRRFAQRVVDGELEVSARRGEGLGLLRDDMDSRLSEPRRGEEIPAELRDQIEEPRIILIDKSRIESSIHRAGRLDRVLVKEHDETGTTIGFTIILGLFTFRALRSPGSQIPLLAERLETLLAERDVPVGSHRYKAIVAAFDATPAEFLLASEPEATAEVVDQIVASEGLDGPRLILSIDRNRRSLYAAVVLPRHRYRDELRSEIGALLTEQLDAVSVDHRTSFLEEDTALLSYFCTAAQSRFGEIDPSRLEARVRACIARWQDQLAEGLVEVHGESKGMALLARYRAAFPEAYRVATDPMDAVRDIDALETLAERRSPQFALYFDRGGEADPRTPASGPESCTLKLCLDEPRLLSDLLPVVDRFGIRVVDARQARVVAIERAEATVVALRILPLGERQTDLDQLAPRLGDALRAALTATMADDPLNGLVLAAGLSWREVDLLRAYLDYFNQIQGTLTLAFVRGVLLAHPAAVRLLLDYHAARLGPGLDSGVRIRREQAVAAELDQYRDRVTSLNEDRALGGLYELIDATLRTSFFAERPGRHRIAIRFDPSRIRDVAKPHPYRETFVHGPEVTGIHIRGGPIARGGLRWSDRVDDVRTEVLGLMRTQMLKNGVIVPVGAKGGFLTRGAKTLTDPRGHADEQYREFISGLLDINDDLAADGQIVAPADVHRRDGDDPYLVVAADKGTAHLSDTANAVALERGFWLGDAFASGGSNGYDHKKLAITARGAWACVVHHLAELGIDPERDPYTLAGIGDMSGDVFGNGLLIARGARLLAAFDHRNVFLDPDPDPDVAWAERRRLFELPGSSWADYDPQKISAGGGVFARAAKQIPLSAAMRKRLDVDVEEATGEEVVRAILRMPVDVLWNGGIGTWVKASDESHADVRDRTGDAVRVDAAELRARVFGEGGNLGLTQRARSEAAAAGVRLNMDAIDNSAGVDLSDHEVNFKILLAPLVRTGRLTERQRNDVLVEVAEQACERVLAHSRAQALCISLDERRSQLDPEPFLWATSVLCEAEGLDPRDGVIPDAAELEARRGGLLRPELAWLLGLAKLHLQRALLAGDWADHPCAEPLYRAYFPDVLVERFPEAVDQHPLRREITAMAITNRLIDLGGVSLIPSLMRELDIEADEAGVVALLASEFLGRFDYRGSLLADHALDREEVYRVFIDLDSAVRSVARLLSRRSLSNLGLEDLARWRDALDRVRAIRSEFPADNPFARGAKRGMELRAKGFTEALAADAASTPLADLALSLIGVADRTGASLRDVALAYAHVGEHSGLNWVYARSAAMPLSDPWDRISLIQLRGFLIDLHDDLTEAVLADRPADPEAAAAQFLSDRAVHVERIRRLEQRALGTDRLSSLAVVARAIERLREAP